MDTDREIINRILDGDTNSFRELVENYQRLVFHIVFRTIQNQTDCEEIAQDVFIKVYQNLSNFKFESKFSTWIGKITYNTCINYLQKKKVPLYEDIQESNNYNSEKQLLESVGDNSNQPDLIIEEKLRDEILYKEIANLPAQQRTIITLYHLDQMSYNEIGEIMNLPEGTVKSYLFRARKMLKEKLLEQYKIEEIYR